MESDSGRVSNCLQCCRWGAETQRSGVNEVQVPSQEVGGCLGCGAPSVLAVAVVGHGGEGLDLQSGHGVSDRASSL